MTDIVRHYSDYVIRQVLVWEAGRVNRLVNPSSAVRAYMAILNDLWEMHGGI